MFLLTCSPDFDPIVYAVSTLDHQRRQIAADTRATVHADTKRLWPTIIAANAHAFFQMARYNV